MAGFGLGNYINPGVGSFIDQRRNALAGLGAGFLNGQPGAGVQAGIQADDAYATQQRAEADRQKAIAEQAALKSKYAEWFTQRGRPDIAMGIADGAIDYSKAYWDHINPQQAGGDAPASIQEWNAYNGMTPEQKAEYLRMKRSTPYLDVGTGFVQPDPLNPGQTSGNQIVKDNFTPSYDSSRGTASGKVAAEVGAEAASLASKMPGLKTVVEELGTLADQATYTQAGQLWDNIARETGQMPSEGALARTKYMAMVDNQVLPLLRDTFGAAFTVKEGETLRATLGAPDKSPAEKKAVLEAFIEQKTRDLQALQSRAGGGPAGSSDVDAILKGYGL